MKTFAQFKEAMQTPQMQADYAALTAGPRPADDRARLELVVRFAAEHGYAVTVEELSFDIAARRKFDNNALSDSFTGGCVHSYYKCQSSYERGENCWGADDCNYVVRYY